MAANHWEKGPPVADRLFLCRRLRIFAILLALLPAMMVCAHALNRFRSADGPAASIFYHVGGGPAVFPAGRAPRLPAARQDRRMTPHVPFAVPEPADTILLNTTIGQRLP